MADVATVLGLLHDAPERVRRLRADIVMRVDEERAHAAFRRMAERSGGTTLVTYGEDDEDDEEELEGDVHVRVWADLEGDLRREERTGPYPSLAVRRGATWWRWDPQGGSVSNEGEEHVDSSVADELRWILGGLRTVASLRLHSVQPGVVAGRPTWRCRGSRREDEDAHFHRAMPIFGADEYELDVDRELGLIVRLAGFFEGALFSELELTELGVDEPLDDELFVFASPDGSPVRGAFEDQPRPHVNLTPARLLELASFRVFAPRRTPEGWDVSLTYVEPMERPAMAETVSMHLHSPDALRSVAITQVAASAAGQHDEWDHAKAAPWERTERDGVAYEWRDPAEEWQPARVRFERDGTRVLVDSTSLPAAELLELAAAMVPLPADPPGFA